VIAVGQGYRAVALFLFNSCLAVFLSYGVFFNKVSSEYGLPASATSFVFGVFAIFYSVSTLVLGLYMNKSGPGKTILLGGALMGAGMILSSLANAYPLLVFAYGVIGGLGSGSMWLPTSYVVLDTFDSRSVKKVVGLVSAGTASGLFFFPPLESYLIENWGLKAAFLSVGFLILAFTLFAYLSSMKSKVIPNFNIRKAFSSLRTKHFGYLYAYYAIGNAFSRTLVLIFMVPLFASRGFGTVGSIALSLVGVGSMAGRLTTGIKRINEESVTSLGFILQGVSAAALYFANNPLIIALLALALGVGYGAYIPEFPLMVRKYYGTEFYGTIFGTLLTSFGIGAFVGPVFEGIAVSSSWGYLPGFITASALSLLVGFHLLLSKNKASSIK
jgi:MFS family permease